MMTSLHGIHLLLLFLSSCILVNAQDVETNVECVGADPFTTYQPACSYTEGETVLFHAYTDTVSVFANLYFPIATGLFYTSSGCLVDEGLAFGDPNVDCTKKASPAEDFALNAIEHDGQWEAINLLFPENQLDYVSESYVGDLDYVPIDTLDDCEVEGDEVFSVLSRSQIIGPGLTPSDPEDGFEVVIVDNDSEVNFDPDQYTAYEGADGDTQVVLNLIRTGFTATSKTIEYSTVSRSAESTDDFTPAENVEIFFGDGSEMETIEITIKSDGVQEGSEVFAVHLYHPPDDDPTVCTGKIGRRGIAYITVHDPEGSAGTGDGGSGGTGTGGSGDDGTGGTGTGGSGDGGTGGTGTGGSGDGGTGGSGTGGGTGIGDDAVGEKGCVSVSTPTDAVIESSPSVEIALLRSGNLEEPVDIVVSTSDVDAKSGLDYLGLQSYVVRFEPNETTATFNITIRNDYRKEGDEIFKIKLHSTVDSVDICTDSAVVFIKDDDDQFSFESDFSIVTEDQCIALKILRFGYLDQTKTVRVAVEHSNAQANDYDIFGIDDPIVFQNYQEFHELQICAMNDDIDEIDEEFALVLQPNDTNHEVIGYPDRARIVISSQQPTCVPLAISSGNVEPLLDSYDVNAQVTISCETGYQLYGMSLLTCNRNDANVAFWLPQPPFCIEEATCVPVAIANGNVEPLLDSYDVDTQVTFSCVSGYELVGISQLTCSHIADNVVWLPQPPICIKKATCVPLAIANGNVEPLLDSYDVNAQVTISCEDGYQLVGISQLTCSQLAVNVALWLPQPPICFKEDTSTIIALLFGGISFLLGFAAVSYIIFTFLRKATEIPKNPLIQNAPPPQSDVVLLPYDGVNPQSFDQLAASQQVMY